MRETAAGQYGALDRKAIMDADLSLMMAVVQTACNQGDCLQPRSVRCHIERRC
jgi:hypothetical protein